VDGEMDAWEGERDMFEWVRGVCACMPSIEVFIKLQPTNAWAMSWSTPAATRVLSWWAEKTPFKGVALNDGIYL